MTQLLISSNMQEKNLQQVDLWFPEVNFFPTDYGSNTVKSNIKSQVSNTICSKGFAGHTARRAKPGQRGHSAVLNLPSHGWAPPVEFYHSVSVLHPPGVTCLWWQLGLSRLPAPGCQAPQGFQQGTNYKAYEYHYSALGLHDPKGLFQPKWLFHVLLLAPDLVLDILRVKIEYEFLCIFLCYKYFQIEPCTLSMVAVKSDCRSLLKWQ